MKNKLKRLICSITVICIISGITSCGTILYPERRNQPAGRLDVGVVALDGIGLLLFLVPGVIAFAVDFATGAVYLPPGRAKLELKSSNLKSAHILNIDKESLSRRKIEELVKEEFGQKINLSSSKTKVARIFPGEYPEWVNINEVLTPQQLASFRCE